MIARSVRWGVIHGGEFMYIVTIDKKRTRPIIIISGRISMAATSVPTPLALICYMLLTGDDRDSTGVVDQAVLSAIPNPTTQSTRDVNVKFSAGDEEDDDDDGGHSVGDKASFMLQATFQVSTQHRCVYRAQFATDKCFHHPSSGLRQCGQLSNDA